MKRGIGIILCLLTLACAGGLNKTFSPRELGQLTYPSDFTDQGWVRLTDGLYEAPVVPGSASMVRIALMPEMAMGDLNGDGGDDAVVVLESWSGGSGTFYHLVAVLNGDKGLSPVSQLYLGDRIRVQSVRIESGRIQVRFLDRAADAPMMAEPTIPRTCWLELTEGNGFQQP